MPELDFPTLVGKWLDGQVVDETRIIRLGNNFVDVSRNFVDITKLTGQLIGTAAITYNRVVIVNELFADDITSALKQMALHRNYTAFSIPNKQMIGLRVHLRANTILNVKSGQLFRRALGRLADTFPRLDGSRMINHARITNAFKYRGKMTHGLLTTTLEGEQWWCAWYENTEDAVLGLMKIDRTENIQLMEIGG